MSATPDQYKVRPRKSHDGWNLEGQRLSHGLLWYQSEADAIGYTEWHSRVKGCKVEVLDLEGKTVRTEEFAAGNFAY
ncbi:MAG: hypothetical protein M3Y27_09330 [Acidobacteriota bacterium]|nr:hypothetical protein [Acidobacteriota bacterium]